MSEGPYIETTLAVAVAVGDPCAVLVGLLRGPTLPATLGLPAGLIGGGNDGVIAGVGGGVAAIRTPELSNTLGDTPVTFANRKHARLGSMPAQEYPTHDNTEQHDN